MQQETTIKVNIDDNEALQRLREMASLVDSLGEGLGGLAMPPSEGGKRRQEREQEQQEEERRVKNIYQQAGERFGSAASQILMQGGNTSAGGIAQTLGNSLKDTGKMMGAILGPLFMGGGVALEFYGKSLSERQAMAQEVANLEALETRIAGSLDSPDVKGFAERESFALADIGLDPVATRELIASVASAAGMKMTEADLGQLRLQELAEAQKLGISPESIASLAGSIVTATGSSMAAALDDSLMMRRLAENKLDLRGSGVDEFLSTMGSFVDDLSGRGIRPSLEMLKNSIGSIAAVTGTRGRRPAQIMQGLQGTAGGALGQLTAPFQGLAQTALLAEAFSQSSDYFGAMEFIEDVMKRPTDVTSIMNRTFGRDSKTILASIPSIGTGDASLMALGDKYRQIDAGGPRVTSEQIIGMSAVSSEIARQQQAAVEVVRKDPQSLAELVKLSGDMRVNLLKASENTETMKKVVEAVESVQGTVAETVNKVAELLDKIF